MKNGLQTLEDIFKENSSLSKEINALKKQIETAKPILESFHNCDDTPKNGEFEESECYKTVLEMLKVFYPKGAVLERQVSRLERARTKEAKMSLIYNIMASRMEALDRMKDKLDSIINGY